jgi:RHS repeat-associated protein
MLAIQERSGSNVPEVSYTRGWDLSGSLEGAGGIGGLLARSRSYSSGTWGNHDFYHADGNGNITMMLDSSQAIVATYKYDPYGNNFTASGALASANLYRFSSKLWCANAGLYYYGYRFYDPNLQRWLNRDPIGENGGINLYGFVHNSPVSTVDAYGWSDYNRPPAVVFPGGGVRYGPPRTEPNGRPSESKVGCALRAGKAAREKYLAANGTRYTHCMASCEIAKQCGRGASAAAGLAKELADLARCLLTNSSDYCYSAFQPSDDADNKQGRNCPPNESCEDRCKDLKGAPEAPPGPFNTTPEYGVGMF